MEILIGLAVVIGGVMFHVKHTSPKKKAMIKRMERRKRMGLQ